MKFYNELYKEYLLDKKYGTLLSVDSNINYLVFIDCSHSCNYNCSYCINSNYKYNNIITSINKNKFLNKNRNGFNKISKLFNIDVHKPISDFQPDIINICKFLNILNTIKNIKEIVLSGLESTLNKKLFEIIDYLNSNLLFKFELKIQTNGSQNVNFYKKLISNFYNINLDISFHPEFANEEHFIELINMLNENNCRWYSIKLLLSEFYSDKIHNFFDKIKKISKRIRLLQLKDRDTDIIDNLYFDLFEYVKQYNLDSGDKLIYNFEKNSIAFNFSEMNFFSQQSNTFKNMYCDLANKRIDILNNKICHNCSCILDRQFELCDYNIYIDWLKNFKPVLCCKDKCFCPPNLIRNI